MKAWILLLLPLLLFLLLLLSFSFPFILFFLVPLSVDEIGATCKGRAGCVWVRVEYAVRMFLRYGGGSTRRALQLALVGWQPKRVR